MSGSWPVTSREKGAVQVREMVVVSRALIAKEPTAERAPNFIIMYTVKMLVC